MEKKGDTCRSLGKRGGGKKKRKEKNTLFDRKQPRTGCPGGKVTKHEGGGKKDGISSLRGLKKEKGGRVYIAPRRWPATGERGRTEKGPGGERGTQASVVPFFPKEGKRKGKSRLLEAKVSGEGLDRIPVASTEEGSPEKL